MILLILKYSLMIRNIYIAYIFYRYSCNILRIIVFYKCEVETFSIINNLYRMAIFMTSYLAIIKSRGDFYHCLILREISCKVHRSHDYMS